MEAASPLLSLRNLTKRFAGVAALNEVSLDVAKGAVHAVVGQNGAGKSTLMKLLVGVHQPDSGEMLLREKPYRVASPLEARGLGVDIVFQEIELPPNLTVADCVFLAREPRKHFALDYAAMASATVSAMARLGIEIAPDRVVENLSVAEKQLVQVARALVGNAEIIILDEPTSALSDHEVERLFDIISRLRADGATMLYVSHKLEEIFRLADTVTALRDGTVVGTKPCGELDSAELVALMAGAPPEVVATEFMPKRPAAAHSETPALEVRSLSRRGVFEDISLMVAKSEIVGLFGIVGAGRTELVRALFGLDPPERGEIRMNGVPMSIRSPSQAIKLGLGLVPEDRKTQGLLLETSLLRNCSLAALPELTSVGCIRTADEWKLGEAAVRRLSIMAANLEQEAASLSGGNQQKTVIARWLALSPRVLLMDEPTKGIDVGAKREVYSIIRTLADSGMGILLITSELDEALELPDRLLIMRSGRLSAELDPRTATRTEVLRHAV